MKKSLKITLCGVLIIAFVFPLLSFVTFFKSSKSVQSASAYMYDSMVADSRLTFDFNSNWSFSKGQGVENSGSTKEEAVAVTYIPNNATIPVYSENYVENTYENESWQTVSLPHTYNDTDTFDDYVEALDGNTKLSHNGERTMYGGTAWYKKSFYIPNTYEGKKVFVEFEAARQSAQIWINGTRIEGTSLNGFIAFGYDISDNLRYSSLEDPNGAWNEITVLVDNSYPYYVSVDENGDFVSMYDDGSVSYTLADNPIVWHDSHWHPNYGGLYRNSYLHVLNDLYLTLPLYSFMETQGTYVYTSDETITKNELGVVTASSAVINVDAEIKNESLNGQNFKFVARIKDMDNTIVGEITSFYKASDVNQTLNVNQSFSSGEKTRLIGSTTINNVKRWSPDYPYLYTVECMIIQTVNDIDVVVDNNSNQIGVRTFRATSDNGFFINENFIYFHGWGQKSTNEWAGIGAAYQDWMQEYVVYLMKQGGGNYIRYGHTAGSPAQITAADKLGLIVTQPGVDGEGPYSGEVTASTKLAYTQVTKTIRMDAFRDMIIYFRNHASILFWEIGNNTMDVSMAATIRNYIDTYDYAGRNPTTGKVSNSGKMSATASTSSRLADVRRVTDDTTKYVDVAETTEGSGGYGGKPKVEGEYNRFESRRGVWDLNTLGFESFSNNFTAGNSSYQYMTSESFAVEQVNSYHTKLLTQGLNHMGGANWIFSDSISHGRLLSEVARCSGEVDATMLEKESYYVTQVLYDDVNVKSHIIGHWNYSNKNTLTKYVVSKAHSVKLKVIYDDAGEEKTLIYTGVKSNEFLFTFSDIQYHAGRIECVGYDIDNNIIASASDVVYTHGAPAGITITQNVVSPNGLKANGSDYLILDIAVVDANGNRCLTFDGQFEEKSVLFTLNGEGTTCNWIGGYNSSIEDTIRSKSLYFEAGLLRVAIRTTLTPGNMSLTATMGVLSATSNTFTSVAETNMVNSAGQDCNYSLLTTRIQQADLDSLTEPVYDSVDSYTIIPDNTPSDDYISIYVNDLECYGPVSFYEVTTLTAGHLLYSDYSYTWSTIPRKYLNGEYVILNNANSSSHLDTLISVSVRLNCTMILLFPVNADIPSWVSSSGFTLDPNQTFISNLGVIYEVWAKEVVGNTVYSLGSPDPNNNAEVMYILGCCIPLSSATNPAVLDETFPSTWTTAEAFSTHGAVSIAVTNTILEPRTILGKDALYIQDTSLSTTGTSPYTAYIAYPIGNRTSGKFEISFDYWLDSTKTTDYGRLFLQQGTTYSNIGDNSALRFFFENSEAKAFLDMDYRVGKDSESNIVKDFTKRKYSSSVWHSFKILVDMTGTTRTATISILSTDDDTTETPNTWETLTTVSFAGKANSNLIDHIMFAGGNNKSQYVAIANVRVELITDNITYLTGVSIDEVPLTGFHQDTHFYYMGELSEGQSLPTISDITLNKGNDFIDYDAENEFLFNVDDYKKKITITVRDSNNATHEYTFSYAYYSEYAIAEARTFYDKIIYSISEDRPRELMNLYEGRQAYLDMPATFSSVPYEYCGAEVSKINSTDTVTSLGIKFRNDTVIILMVRLFESHNQVFEDENWTKTGQIVSLSNDWIYMIFTKTFVKDTLCIIDYKIYNFLTTAPIIAFKPIREMNDRSFLYEDFSYIDNSNPLDPMPYDWKKFSASNATITYQQEDTSLLFTDTAIAPTQFACIQKSFSNQTNKFVFSTQMNFDATTHYDSETQTDVYDYSAKFVRFWLKNGEMKNATDYAAESEKMTCALELYFKDGSNGTITLYARKRLLDVANREAESSTNTVDLLTGIPRGYWLTYYITVDCQLHNFTIYATYIDGDGILQTITKASPVSFLKNLANTQFLVDNINTLMIGSGGNAINKFKVRSIEVKQLSENIVQNITVNYAGETINMAGFNELTKEYVIELDANNTLPSGLNITVSQDASYPNIIPINETHCYYDVVITYDAVDSNTRTYKYRVHIYAHFQPLQSYISQNMLPESEYNKYTSDSITALDNAYQTANTLVTNKSHNYYSLTNAQNSYEAAYNALVHSTVVTDSAIGQGKQITKSDLTESDPVPSFYYDSAFTIAFDRTINDAHTLSSGHVISFNNNLPVGTILTLADYQGSNVSFYYCEVTESKNTFSFINDFIKMGFDETYYLESPENYSGQVRLYIDLSNATKLLGLQTATLTINNDATSEVSYNLIDRDIPVDNLSISFDALNEKEYALTSVGTPSVGYYAISMDTGAYVLENSIIYPANDSVILLPSSISTAKLIVRTQKTVVTNYSAYVSTFPSCAISLPISINGISIKASINDNDKIVYKSNIPITGSEIIYTTTILGTDNAILNCLVEKYVLNTGFSGNFNDNIIFDTINNKFIILNTIDIGSYRIKIYFTENDVTYFDYVYILVN